MRIHRLTTAFIRDVFFGSIWLALIWPSVGLPASARELPKRLSLKVEKGTLRVGEQTRLTVEFLDRRYRKVPNDRAREISFTQASAGQGPKGTGEITPTHITVQKGAQSATATFTANGPGKLMTRVTSAGLSPAQTLVVIVPQTGSLLSQWLSFSVHAQANVTVEILPEDVQHAPANDGTPVTLWVSFRGRELEAGEELRIRVTTQPLARVVYQNQEAQGFAEFTLDQGHQRSDPIAIFSSTPGPMRVLAENVTPGSTNQGSPAQVAVEFEFPRPVKIIFESEDETITSRQRKVPLSIRLADQDDVPIAAGIAALDQAVRVRLSSPTDSADVVEFDPDNIELSRERPFAQSMLSLRQLPTGSEIQLLAQDVQGGLQPGKKTITLMDSSIEKVVVEGPSEVDRGGQEYEFSISLADESDRLQTADWDREIILSVDGGKVRTKNIPPSWASSTEVVIAEGQARETVKYKSPPSVGEFTIKAASGGLETGTQTIRVVTTGYVLVLFAGLGGMLGGLFRQMKRQVRRIMPHRVHGIIDFGLVGNSLLSFGFGLVLFQAVKLGLVAGLDSWERSEGVYTATRTFAFFFGVLGGFGGTFVLDGLLRRVFPESRKQETLG